MKILFFFIVLSSEEPLDENSRIQKLEEELLELKKEIKVTDRCTKVCSENLENKTFWRQCFWDDAYHDNCIETLIDISHCGFIRKPALGRSLKII